MASPDARRGPGADRRSRTIASHRAAVPWRARQTRPGEGSRLRHNKARNARATTPTPSVQASFGAQRFADLGAARRRPDRLGAGQQGRRPVDPSADPRVVSAVRRAATHRHPPPPRGPASPSGWARAVGRSAHRAGAARVRRLMASLSSRASGFPATASPTSSPPAPS